MASDVVKQILYDIGKMAQISHFLRVPLLGVMCILIMSILKCVFLYSETGQIFRSGTEVVSDQDRKYFPVRAGEDAWTRVP